MDRKSIAVGILIGMAIVGCLASLGQQGAGALQPRQRPEGVPRGAL